MRLFQPKFSKASFSQSGEDLIVEFIFNSLNIPVPTYIDIGAYHPYRLNNTAHFYQNGCRGINIEPNSQLFQVLKKVRPKDINLNIGIGDTQGNADFYILSSPTLSTFSKDKAEWYVGEHEQRMKEIRQMPVDTLPNIIARYSKGIFPDFLSLDVEGLDFEILQSIDYSGSIPIVICVETLSYSSSRRGKKDEGLIRFLDDKGYMVYADTYINTIFVKRSAWEW